MYKIKNKEIIETNCPETIEKQFKKRKLKSEYEIYEKAKNYILNSVVLTFIFTGLTVMFFHNEHPIKDIVIYTVLISMPMIFIANYINTIIDYRNALTKAVEEQKTTFFCTGIQKKHTKYYITILGRPVCEIKSRQNIETYYKRCHFFPVQDLKVISHKKQPVE